MKIIVLTLALLLIPTMILAHDPSKEVIKSLEIEKIELKEIDLVELQATAQKSCSTYHCPGVSVLDQHHLTSPEKKCICKTIDKVLKPICEQEQTVKGLLKQKYNKNKTKELEDYLTAIEDAKSLFVKEIYEMTDEFNKAQNEALDSIEKSFKNKKKQLGAGILKAIAADIIKTEIENTIEFVDYRIQKVCGN